MKSFDHDNSLTGPAARHGRLVRLGLTAGTLFALIGLSAAAPVGAVATRPGVTPAANTGAAASAQSSGQDQAKLKAIISRGDKEITRRLKTLNTLSVKINGAQKLSTDSKSVLLGEVNGEIGDLTSLKAKLDADTDLTTARSDAQSIFSGYRVYALIVPKVNLIKTADDQQVAEGKLSDLAAKLQTRLTAARNDGKDVGSLQNALDDLNAKTKAAQGVSSGIEAAVINLQPSDYNSNHQILSGDRDKLKSAQDNIKAATADAKTVVTGLKNL
jgi:hypothetical protein